MNKKGFAVSVILYSIVFLIITILFMLLGIMRTRYTVTNKLRKNIIDNINDKVEIGVVFPSSSTCSISANTSNYTNNLVLTINALNGRLYSWNNETYSTNNTTTVNRSGTYNGYFKDSAGGSGSCSIEIESKTRYQYRECAQSNIRYGAWYSEESFNNSCTEITKVTAESNNTALYRTCSGAGGLSVCGNSDGSTCFHVMTYRRNATGCNWGNETWKWSDIFPGSSATKQFISVTTYRVKSS